MKSKIKLSTIIFVAACLSTSLPFAAKFSIQECKAQEADAVETIADSSHPKGTAAKSDSKNEGKKMAEIYEFKAKALDGSEINLDKYKGDVLLIVNTASACGYTPQYAGLEALHKKFGEKGLKILGFPCNQFGKQEQGDSHTIANFCQKNYGVEFQMFEKVDVNGKEAIPLYHYLTGENNGSAHPIKWNFTKFLVDRKGNVVKRFEPDVKPEDLTSDIEKQL